MRALLALAALIATPAFAQPTHDSVMREEVAFQALNAADAATTCIALSRGAKEANPLFGKKPSCGKVIAVKAAAGALHWFFMDRTARHDPETARWVVRGSILIQGGVVGWNIGVIF